MHTTTVATTAPRKSRPSTRICELGSTGASSNLVVSTASKPETPTRPFKVRGTDQVSRLPFDQDPPKCIKFFKFYTERVIKMQRKQRKQRKQVEFVELHTLSLSIQRAAITKYRSTKGPATYSSPICTQPSPFSIPLRDERVLTTPGVPSHLQEVENCFCNFNRWRLQR